MDNKNKDFDQIVNHLKNSGYVFQGSEIYGGLANTWDYGYLGVELKNNLKRLWWKNFVYSNPYNVGLDSSILLNSKVWQTSGHVDTFSDPLMDCKSCKTRHRADQLIESAFPNENITNFSNKDLFDFIVKNKIKCPKCGALDYSDIREFNLLFKTYQGVLESGQNIVYLRPETAQGIFINFKNLERTTRKKLPFGVCQIGKSFRNEITPGNFIFRTREFEQMEIEFFLKPGEDDKWFDYWKKECLDFLLSLGLNKNHLRYRDHSKEELSFYSKATSDIEYLYSFGWGELLGIANRTDYDLKKHSQSSNSDLSYFDQEENKKYYPYCIEPSFGVERLLLALLNEAYVVETLEDGEKREVLKLDPRLSPLKACIMPLSKKLGDKAKEVYNLIRGDFNIDYDESGSIGKRYRRQDSIGTPFCITIDFDSLEDNSVTVRDRDSMEQTRIEINELKKYLNEKIS